MKDFIKRWFTSQFSILPTESLQDMTVLLGMGWIYDDFMYRVFLHTNEGYVCTRQIGVVGLSVIQNVH